MRTLYFLEIVRAACPPHMRALLPRIGSTVYQACRAHLSRQWPIACCAPAALSRARPLCSAMASLAGRSQEAPLAAVAQMTATGDTNRNFETCKELAEVRSSWRVSYGLCFSCLHPILIQTHL